MTTRKRVLLTIAALWVAALIIIGAQAAAGTTDHPALCSHTGVDVRVVGDCGGSFYVFPDSPGWTETDMARAVSFAAVATLAAGLAVAVTLVWTR